MTKILYWETPILYKWTDAYVVSSGQDQLGHWLELNETIAHPRGGGQLGDRGLIDQVKFNDTRRDRDSGAIRHYLNIETKFREGQSVSLEIDAAARHTNSLWHTAGHLIAATVEKIDARYKAVNGHHFPGEGRVEFQCETFTPVNLDDVNIELSRLIDDALPVVSQLHPSDKRTIAIGSFPNVGCGGSHVSSLEDFKMIKVTKANLKAGTMRLSYQAQ